MTRPPRWLTDTAPGHSDWYVERFRTMARDGADLAGEARLIDALVAPGSTVLDAGCGPGRVGGELHRRGHRVIGVDVDPVLIEAAEQDHPGPTWLVGDLAELDLSDKDLSDQDRAEQAPEHVLPVDAAVIAGNVMTFLAEGTEAEVLRRVAAHVRPDGPVVIGFGTDRGYAMERFDADLAAAGLVVELRTATWDLRPYHSEATFAVTIARVSAA